MSFFERVSLVITRRNAAMTPHAPFPELTKAPALSPHYDANAYVEENTRDEKTAIQPMTITTAQYKYVTFSLRYSIENKTGIMHNTIIKMDNPMIIGILRFFGLKKINKNDIIADGILYERLKPAPMLMLRSENKGEKISIAFITLNVYKYHSCSQISFFKQICCNWHWINVLKNASVTKY